MSRRPGIASGWFDKFKSDVYPRDARVIKGVDTKPCKFYDSLYEKENEEDYKRIKASRYLRGSIIRDRELDTNVTGRLDFEASRLAVKEKVKLAQIASLSTSLED